MRSILFAVLLLSALPVAFGTTDSPLFSVKQESNNSVIHLTGTNMAQSPVLAYVVVAEIGRSRKTWKTWKSVCNTGEELKPGMSIEIGTMNTDTASGNANVVVDSVRLADGTKWGPATTKEAKEIGARFKK
jgi:hypothetical protein